MCESILIEERRQTSQRNRLNFWKRFYPEFRERHIKTEVRRQQSNGFVERMHRTLLDEHFRIKGREKFYEAISEMQEDLEVYLKYYNEERIHQEKNMNGRTPKQAFLYGIRKKKKSGNVA